MNKLIKNFLYPVKEFFSTRPDKQHLSSHMDQMINSRYRNKGYEINFLVFEDREVSNLFVGSKDKVLKSNVKLNSSIEGKGGIPYTSNDLIKELLGSVDELVVCGFHAIDCVRKVARFFHDLGVDTLVDIELTDNLDELSKLDSFNVDSYNLADILECKFTAIYKDGDDSYVYFKGGNIYDEAPYYKLKSFAPNHSWKEWLTLMKDRDLNNLDVKPRISK